MHTKSHNSIGDVYLTIAEEILKTPDNRGTCFKIVPRLSEARRSLHIVRAKFIGTESEYFSGHAAFPGI